MLSLILGTWIIVYMILLTPCFSDARNMARDVHKCLMDVITEKGDKSSNEAEDYIKKLQQKGRYAQDVWS